MQKKKPKLQKKLSQPLKSTAGKIFFPFHDRYIKIFNF